MAREADYDMTGRAHEHDAWFDEGGMGSTPTGRRNRRRLVLGFVLVALVLLGVAIGAFASNDVAPGPDLERLRARARAAGTSTPMAAGGSEALLTGLERLAGSMPAPVADVVAAPEVESDAAVAGGEVDTGPVAPIEAPKPKVSEPKASEPKLTVPKAVEPKVAEPPKEPEPKPDPKAAAKVEDPKLKGPVDQALADARTHQDAGRWAEARTGYDKVLALSPGNTRALLGRGRSLLELRQVQPALKDIKAVLEVEPRNPTALLLAGSINQELGQKDQARGYYQRYLDAWPSGRKSAEVKALLERL